MPYVSVKLERETLYREVWAEPVTKVSKRYGLSDVGLKKVCRKLQVPMPPRGYWARIAAGQSPKKTPLLPTTGETVHVVQRLIAPPDVELEARLATVLGNTGQHAEPAALRTSIDDCLPVVRRMADKLAKAKYRTDRGWLAVAGTDAFSLEVSESTAPRALLLLDALLRTCMMAGAKIKGPVGPGYPAHFVLNDEPFTVRVRERGRQPASVDSDTAARLSKMGAERRADAAASEPTGLLSVTVVPLRSPGMAVKWRDKVKAPLQARLGEIADYVRDLTQLLRVERDLAAERRQRAEEEAHILEQKREIRRAHLRRLEVTYEKALRWQRAQLLKAYLAELIAQHPNPTREVASEISWLQSAAEWLDPVTARYWPEVDYVEDRYHSYLATHPLWVYKAST